MENKSEQDGTTNDAAIRKKIAEKLERFLARACEAEAGMYYFRAARTFALALYCEGMLCTLVTDACRYVRHSLPVY